MAIRQKIRTSKGNGETRQVSLTPIKAIRHQCVECCGWSPSVVRECTDTHCPLYPFRMGKNPSRKRRRETDRNVGDLSAEVTL